MSHYFHTPENITGRRTITARIWDVDYEFDTANGVFSADGLDLGTSVLLRESWPPDHATRLLDLGCGWGPIAVALARECLDAIVDAVDTNELALALTAANAERAGVPDRVRPTLPQHADPDARYDEIWSNPPIRIGKDALHDLLLTWLPRLTDDGVARLVVGRNLGADSLQRWLLEQGYACERVGSAKGFRVFAVTK
ncbi:methyltransferase [Ammonicoccus fulvus]|uniref:Methyltransferase n=1 Tax=Ammonicoccus fulvus TaxID=3138240 RepID=A0ABZ3FUR7_9ACTN